MAIHADLYYSIRSPYSYIGLRKLDHLLPEQPVEIRLTLKPVLPIAVRRPEIFKNASPMALRYLEADTRRAAEMYGIDFRIWPVPDPIVQNMETLEIAAEQPYIHRLTRLMQYACERGAGYPFILRLATLIWDGKTDAWDEGDHIARVAESAGLSLDEMEAAIDSEADRYDAAIQANQASLFQAGHWGVPTIVYEGEPFFGQDRIETFLWRVTDSA